ncbi:hypothetical protein CsSME_00022178 [Camellia sinensis var. sinensis]
MNRLRSFFEFEESFTEFRALYSVPEDVIVHLPTFDDSLLEGSEERIPLHLIDIIERGLKFPLHPFLRELYFKPRSVKHQLVQMLLNSGKALEVFSHSSEWEDQVNLPLLRRAWSYRGPPEQQGQGQVAHVLLAYVPHYGTVTATYGINLGADGGFNFYILPYLREDSSSSEATIFDTMMPKNFLEIAAAQKRKRTTVTTLASQTSSNLATADRSQDSLCNALKKIYINQPFMITIGMRK